MRDLYVNNQQLNEKFSFCSNYIRTTKYTFLTFLPLSIFYQYLKLANCYFLFLSILSCLNFSPWEPVTQITPTVTVIIVSIMREAYEDF